VSNGTINSAVYYTIKGENIYSVLTVRMFGCVVKEDGLWGPAPALNPLLARQQAAARQQQQQLKHGQQSNKSATHTASRSSAAGSADVSASDAGGGSKKKKRMQKLDSSVLGFTVIADPQRTNAGELEKI